MQHHIIHKQKVHIRTDISANAFAVQNRVSNMFKNNLLKRINDVFDKFSDDENILRIDKLEIDVGTIDGKNFEKTFSEKLIVRLTEKLVNYRTTISDNGISEIKKKHSVIDSFIYFLQYGYAAWYQSTKEISEWEDEILNSFSEEYRIIFTNRLKETIGTNGIAIQRLSMQFSTNFLKKLYLYLHKEAIDDWTLFYNKFLQYAEAQFENNKLHLTRKETKNILWEVLLSQALNENEINVSEKIFDKSFDKILTRKLNVFKTDQVIPIQKNAALKITEQKTSIKSKQEIQELFLVNAGIVILHPFLKDYFETLELIKEKIFVSVDAQHRAVLLLHYLATSETEVSEFNLILPKLLCGVNFGEPIENFIELTDKEKEESSDLLKSVTQHWKPLNRTSIEGLQNSFFRRGGKLQQPENDWILRIEQKTIDILLDKLPWTISFIKLPWMKKILYIEWN